MGLSGLPIANAQQTIFDVPSPEITPKNKLFLQHESQFRTWKPGRFLSNTEYSAYGIGHNTELDMTLFNVNAPVSDNITLGLGFKSSIPILKRTLPNQELKVTVGQLVPISLQGGGVGSWSYGTFSGRIPKLKTRLSGGVSVGTKQIFGRNAVSFIGTYEQPITKRFVLQGDWYSGTNNLALFIPGFSYAFPKDITLYGGYQIPNNARSGRQGFVFELAKFF